MIYSVTDLETNGLLPNSNKVISGEADVVTKIYCLSYSTYEWLGGKHRHIKSRTLTDYEAIKNFFEHTEVIVGHDFIRYDMPVAERVLGIKKTSEIIDSLPISWGLYPIKGFKHGLGMWGERLGVEKPVVEQEEWKGLTDEEIGTLIVYRYNKSYNLYRTEEEKHLHKALEDRKEKHLNLMSHRCEEDVKINVLLFHHQLDYLYKLYDGDTKKIMGYMRYLSFKSDCLREQSEAGIVLDRELCEKSILELETDMETKVEALSEAMPNSLGKVLYKKPVRMYKKDGSLSASGLKWRQRLKERDIGYLWSPSVEVIHETPNPNSPTQKKKWLFMMDWNPQTFKENDKGEEIPQISLPNGGGICPSVMELEKVEPAIKHLKGLSVASHRLGVLKGFLKCTNSEGKIFAGAQGLTSTLRLRHKNIVNLPKVGKWYGEQIRGCLTAGESHYMIGSDICGVEDNTKYHYAHFFDPEYVERMTTPGFDGHLYVAEFAKLMTKEDVEKYKELNKKEVLTKEEKLEFSKLKGIRANAKTVNFGGIYGIGIPKLAKQLSVSIEEATKLHTAFWVINKAVIEIAENAKVKKVNGQKWILNPMSGFWYFLRTEKDRFSAINQSSAVWVYDLWLMFVRIELNKIGLKVCLQVHDELLIIAPNSIPKETIKNILSEAMVKVNLTLQLNVTIEIDTQFGNSYKDVH